MPLIGQLASPSTRSFGAVASQTRRRVAFSYTGGDQTIQAPSREFEAWIWGAGGGGGTAGGWSFGAPGGGGGYTNIRATSIPAGTTLRIVVGQGGPVNSSGVAYGGGGQANRTGSDNRYGSGGGGYSGIFLSTVSQATAVGIAGGGGGGGSSRAGTGNQGGAGGGSAGQDGVSPYNGKTAYRGRGGTQSEGGAQASSDSQNTVFPAAALIGGTCRVNGYGGAGGGGYWGGSAGGYSEANTMAGGGGGSGYFNPAYTVAASSSTTQGSLQTVAGNGVSTYPGQAGTGGGVGGAGQNGYIVIDFII